AMRPRVAARRPLPPKKSRGPEAAPTGGAGRRSEPERDEDLEDVRGEAVERLLARHPAGHGQVAEILVLEVDVVVDHAHATALDEPPPAPNDVVARPEAHRLARERRQLLVAGHEVLELRPREQVGVEVRLVL